MSDLDFKKYKKNKRNVHIYVTNRQGNDTSLSTDALGRLSSSTNPLGYTSQSQYNAIDQLTISTNPLGQTSQLSEQKGTSTLMCAPASTPPIACAALLSPALAPARAQAAATKPTA
jgi:YD repeat-containing protein